MTRIEKKVLSINKIYKNDNYQCILCNDVIPVYLLYLISKEQEKEEKISF